MSTSHLQTPTIIQAGILPSWSFRDETLSKQLYYSSYVRNLIGLLRALLWQKKYVIISFFLKRSISGLLFELFYFRLVKSISRKIRRLPRGRKGRAKLRRHIHTKLKLKSNRFKSKRSFLLTMRRSLFLATFGVLSNCKQAKTWKSFISVSNYNKNCLEKKTANRFFSFKKRAATRRTSLLFLL